MPARASRTGRGFVARHSVAGRIGVHPLELHEPIRPVDEVDNILVIVAGVLEEQDLGLGVLEPVLPLIAV
jgi:hypothetical protein